MLLHLLLQPKAAWKWDSPPAHLTSILLEFNYQSSLGAALPALHRLAPQQAFNEYKEVLDGGWMYCVISDGSAPVDHC